MAGRAFWAEGTAGAKAVGEEADLAVHAASGVHACVMEFCWLLAASGFPWLIDTSL